MGRSKRFGLQGSFRGRTFPLPLLFITIAITIIGSPSSLAAEDGGGCTPVLGRVVSLQGRVEARRAGAQAWTRITRLDTTVCEGDRLRAGPASRAALFVQPENLIRLDQNTELTVSHTPEETFIEFFQEPAATAASETTGCGAGYVITRFPKKFRIRTPHVNAAVEGTEFLVAMRCETTELAVFEGKVRAQSIAMQEERVLTSGQALAAGPAEPPAIRLLVKPADAVQWALYYPPLSDASVAEQFPSSSDCLQLPDGLKQVCYSQRAEQLLRLGRAVEAEGEIAQALAESPASGDALAIRAVISVVKNDKQGALSAGSRAVDVSPNSPRAWLALSYAQQAHFRLEDALKSVQRAAEIAADSSLVQARLAEMYMSLGRTRAAEKAARRAVEANPNEERAYTVLGFVHLAQINVKAAQIDFQSALERDSTAPLPRLGLGLAIIRQGQLVPGREQLEIAVALDPTNSLLRSYVGKAYYEENTKERDRLAASQFDLAKQLDPNDPTPWFYAAILKETQNRPLEALEELRHSIEKNNNRAVYRSRLLLEQDRSTRGVSLARIYSRLGFDPQALAEATTSLTVDPTNHSAHRFLSDSYATVERHEIARASELLQSQLFQPVNTSPIQPHVTFLDLAIPSYAPADLTAFNDYSSLVERDRPRLTGAGLTGSDRTWADELVLSGVSGRLSYSIGHFHFNSDGYRENNTLDHDLYDVFAQMAITSEFGLQAELRQRDTRQGDLVLRGDPELLDPFFHRQLNEDVKRVGARYSPTRSIVVIASVFSFDADLEQLVFPSFVEFRDEHGNQGELRGDIVGQNASFTAGVGSYRSDVHQSDTFGTDFRFQRKRQEIYGYVNVAAPSRLLWTAGAAYDSNEREGAFTDNYSRWNAKLGLQYHVTDRVLLRGAVFDTLKTALFVQQTIEPTNIAGFNQFFDDLNGTHARNRALGVDAALTSSTHLTVEYHKRDLDIPLSVIGTGMVFIQHEQEQLARSSLTQSVGRRWALSTQLNFARIETDGAISPFTLLRTQSVPVALRHFTPFGLTVEGRATRVRQEVENSVFVGPGIELSRFTVYDLSLAYRLHRRYGTISLEGRNLTGERFSYMDLNVRNPTINNPMFVPERQVFLRVSFQL